MLWPKPAVPASGMLRQEDPRVPGQGMFSNLHNQHAPLWRKKKGAPESSSQPSWHRQWLHIPEQPTAVQFQ